MTILVLQVVGPMANNATQLFGNYAARTDLTLVSTPLDGLTKVAMSVNFASGCDDNVCNGYNSSAVKGAVTGTNINFVVLGTGKRLFFKCRHRLLYKCRVYGKRCTLAMLRQY